MVARVDTLHSSKAFLRGAMLDNRAKISKAFRN